MWRCVWPLRDTYKDQLVSGCSGLKPSSAPPPPEPAGFGVEFGEFSRTDVSSLCRDASSNVDSSGFSQRLFVSKQMLLIDDYYRMSVILFSRPLSLRYTSGEALSLSCSHSYPCESILKACICPSPRCSQLFLLPQSVTWTCL